jgi:hypothetical protein
MRPNARCNVKTHVLKGSKAEIADSLARIDGPIREVIVVVEEPTDVVEPIKPGEDIFAEMDQYTVQAGGDVDYSRRAVYSRPRDE